jgi:UDP-2,3-diacylglucosamine hydrolase
VLDALRARVQSGTRIALVPGNRDFLLERSFSARTGVELFTEGFVGASDDGCGRVLFVHGDTLCTRDRAYQRLRSVLRAPPVTALAPRLPLAWSLAVARRLRRASVRAVAAKLPEEKSIQRDAVRAAAETAHAALVVCGHAHEYRDERLPSGTRWVVLDAFGGARGVLRFEAEGHLRFTRD